MHVAKLVTLLKGKTYLHRYTAGFGMSGFSRALLMNVAT